MIRRFILMVAVLVTPTAAVAQVQPPLSVDVRHTHPTTFMGTGTVSIEVQLTNTSSVAGTDLVFEEIFEGPHARLQTGVETSVGMVTEDTLDNRYRLDFDLEPGETAIIRYSLRIFGLWPPGPGPHVVRWSWALDLDGPLIVDGGRQITVFAAPRLEISKTDGGAVLEPGGPPVVYRIEVVNSGSQAASGIEIEDQLPPGSAPDLSLSDSRWTCSGGTCRLEHDSLSTAVGDRITADLAIRWPAAAAPAGLEEVSNVVAVRDDGSSGEPSLDEAVEFTPVVAAPDLTVTKRALRASVEPGAAVAFELRVRNNGTQGATGVRITDFLPDAALPPAPDSGWSCGAGVCMWSVGDLASGAEVVAEIILPLPHTVPGGLDELHNVARVADDAANGPDTNPANNEASATVAVEAQPDFRISKVATSVSVRAGAPVTFELTVDNVGNQDATGVVVTDRLPEGLTFRAAEPWSCSGRVCEVSLGSLGAGERKGLLLTGTVVEPVPAGLEALINWASVEDDGANGEDPSPDDNQASALVDVDARPDLRATKTAEVAAAVPGELLPYRVEVTNVGTQAAPDVVLTESVPPGAEFDAAASDPAWTCVERRCDARLGELEGGATRSLRFVVQMESSVPAGPEGEVVRNRASVSSAASEPDPTPDDNVTEVEVAVLAAPDLVVTKDDGGAEVAEGALVPYTIVASNIGTQDATGVWLEEIVPVAAVVENAPPSGWECEDGGRAGARCTYEAGELPAGTSVAVEFTVRALEDHPQVQQLVNSVEVSDDGLSGRDPVPVNNVDTEVTPVYRVEGPDPTPAPILTVLLRDALVVDDDEDGLADRGDVVTYLLDLICGPDGGAAEAVEVLLPVPVHTKLIEGSVVTSEGTLLSARQRILVRIDRVEPGSMISLSYDVLVERYPLSVTELVNQGEVIAGNVAPVLTDDPDTLAVVDPTRTPLDADGGGDNPPQDIPTLGEWGLILFALVILGLAAWFLERRRAVATLLVVAVVLGGVLVYPQSAGAQWAVFDAANLGEQLKQYLQMIVDYLLEYEEYLVEVEQYYQLYLQLQALLQDLEDFDELTSRELATKLFALQARLEEFDGIIYSRTDVHTRFGEYLKPVVALSELLATEEERTRVVLESMQAMLEAARSIGSGSVKSQQDLGAAKAQLDSAVGDLQVMQAAGIISAHTAEEVSRAVELLAASVNTQVVASAHEIAQRASAEATAREWFRSRKRAAPYYAEVRPLSVVPPSLGGRR